MSAVGPPGEAVGRAEPAIEPAEADSEKYRALLDSIDDGFCVIEVLFDADGAPTDYRFIEANRAFEAQTGMRNVIGRRMRELEPRHEEHWFTVYGRIALSGEPERFTRPAKYLGDRWFDLYAFRVGKPEARQVGVLFRDISARMHAEAALRESDQRLQDALAAARMGYWAWDPATDTAVASPSMDELFGVPVSNQYRGDAAGLHVIHPEDRELYRSIVHGAAARGAGWHAEFRVVRPTDGRVLWLQETARVDRDVQGRQRFTGLVLDVTDRKAAEALEERVRTQRERDRFRRQLIAAEEKERQRLARDLHDEAGQHLTALTLGLRALTNVAPPDSDLERRAEKLTALASTLGEELHRVAVHLRPRALDDYGLQAALMSYVAGWRRSTGLGADLHTALNGGRLAPEVESVVYRIVQEGLTNVARHSGASHAGLVVKRQNGDLVVIIEDNGQGFDVEQLAGEQEDVSRLGLRGMRERVELVGGSLDIESTPGVGTAVFARIPIDDMSASGRNPRMETGSGE